jgi:Family of unknown function (DUF5683)
MSTDNPSQIFLSFLDVQRQTSQTFKPPKPNFPYFCAMNTTKRYIGTALALCLAITVQAQQPDSLAQAQSDSLFPALPDSFLIVKKKGFIRRFLTDGYPNPRKAAFMSLAVPGLGQMYNKKWWKLPIVYGAIGTAVYFEVQNIRQYRGLRDNYILLVDGNPNTNPTELPYTQISGAEAMRRYRDQWKRYVEQTSLAVGFIYLLNAADAFVDAHLSRFDVDDDLTLQVRPCIESTAGFGPVFGMGVRVALSKP